MSFLKEELVVLALVACGADGASSSNGESQKLNCIFKTPLQLVFLRPCSSKQLYLPKTWRQRGAMKKGGLCGEGRFSASEDILTLLGSLGGIPGVFSLTP